MPKKATPKPSPEPRAPIDDAVVDSLPYGLVVVQADHTILSTNAAARRFLPQLAKADHCHEAFSCRTPGGACEHGSLAARALARHSPLPEMPIDVRAATRHAPRIRL